MARKGHKTFATAKVQQNNDIRKFFQIFIKKSALLMQIYCIPVL